MRVLQGQSKPGPERQPGAEIVSTRMRVLQVLEGRLNEVKLQ